MSVIAEATLNEVERSTIDAFIAALRERYGNELRAVWLYGSRARGEPPREDSDVDLLVVTDGGRRRDFGSVFDLLWAAASDAGGDPTLFSAVVMSPERVADRREIRSFFIQEVDRDKIVLHETP